MAAIILFLFNTSEREGGRSIKIHRAECAGGLSVTCPTEMTYSQFDK